MIYRENREVHVFFFTHPIRDQFPTCTATVEADNLSFMFWKEPKSLLIAAIRAPSGSPLPPGHRFFKVDRDILRERRDQEIRYEKERREKMSVTKK